MVKASDQPSNTNEAPQTPGEPKPARSQTLTQRDIERLADRLTARGTSMLLKDTPELAGDLRTAARVIHALLSKLDEAAGTMAETARLIAEIHIEVEGLSHAGLHLHDDAGSHPAGR
jgi:hypothetical protein